MASESAPHRGSREEGGHQERGQLLLFPERRAFGPFSWRTVKIASLTILLLILSGALLEFFLGRSVREAPHPTPGASRVPT